MLITFISSFHDCNAYVNILTDLKKYLLDTLSMHLSEAIYFDKIYAPVVTNVSIAVQTMAYRFNSKIKLVGIVLLKH